nr:hypothetical protein CFP56_60848 [Quercus suber]
MHLPNRLPFAGMSTSSISPSVLPIRTPMKIRVTLAEHSEDDAEFDRNFCSCPISQFHAACRVESVLEGCVPDV